ncbi:MAG: recombinase family protein [Deltaproteobacteria bacterium]|jgi:hypothetical protein|nr:recombinase family protein [Deltaproteobacteria bacterium]
MVVTNRLKTQADRAFAANGLPKCVTTFYTERGTKTMTKRKTAVYCRPAIHDEIAVARQERRCREFAAGHGYEIVKTYRDCGVSGVTLVRPAMSKLIADIKTGTIGAVITQDIARIARNFALVSEWLELLRAYGVKLITLAGGEIAEFGNGLTYSLAGDYYLPNIILNDSGEPLRRYGMLHKAYLREEKPALYAELLMTERLYPLCREVDEAAAHRLAAIPDRKVAHEIILSELVYC